MAQTNKNQTQSIDIILNQDGAKKLAYSKSDTYVIYSHTKELLETFKALTAVDSEYTHNNGSVQRLLKISGTIPMYYQNMKYNIPIEIWLMEEYPRKAPKVYVTPTPDMVIKPGHRHVDASGYVLTPYLISWDFTHCNLVDLAQDMSIYFGQEPPLFSRSVHVQKPKSPAKVSQTTAIPGAFATPSRFQTDGPTPNLYTYPGFQQSLPSESAAGGFSAGVSQMGTGWGRESVGIITERKNEPDEKFMEVARAALSERALESLGQFQEILEGNKQINRDIARRTKDKKMAIDSLIAKLQQNRYSCENNVNKMGVAAIELHDWLEMVKAKGFTSDTDKEDIDVHDVFVCSDEISQQALETQAEDLAIEDALYILDSALKHNSIQYNTYLKQVRQLCTKQFFARALCVKIRDLQEHHEPFPGRPPMVRYRESGTYNSGEILTNPLAQQ